MLSFALCANTTASRVVVGAHEATTEEVINSLQELTELLQGQVEQSRKTAAEAEAIIHTFRCKYMPEETEEC